MLAVTNVTKNHKNGCNFSPALLCLCYFTMFLLNFDIANRLQQYRYNRCNVVSTTFKRKKKIIFLEKIKKKIISPLPLRFRSKFL